MEKQAAKKEGAKKKKQKLEDSESSDEDEEILYGDSSDEERPEQEEGKLFPPENDTDGCKYLHTVWDELNPPVEENPLKGKVFAFIYYDPKGKPHLYVGRMLNRFLEDENGPAKEFLIESFKKATTATSIILEETPSHLAKDIATFRASDIICGPLEATLMSGPTGRTGGKWKIPSYPLCVETFEIVKKLEREEEYKRVFPL